MRSTLKFRLMIAFVLIGACATLFVGLGAYYKASSSLQEFAFSQLTSVREAKKNQIENYLDETRKRALQRNQSVPKIRRNRF